MAIDPLGLGGGTTAASSQSSLSKLGADYQSFITLLTAQISNQNPLEPLDSSTFIGQLAQLSQVEQSVAVNSNLEAIASQMASMGAMTGLSLIGRTVTVPSNMIQLDESGATIGYRVASPAASVTATIKGEDGAVLRVLNDLPSELDTLNEVPWDGLDDNGQPVPEGSYSVEITALDEEDNAILTQSYSRSLVERMTFDQGLATLHLANGDSILAGLIEEIE